MSRYSARQLRLASSLALRRRQTPIKATTSREAKPTKPASLRACRSRAPTYSTALSTYLRPSPSAKVIGSRSTSPRTCCCPHTRTTTCRGLCYTRGPLLCAFLPDDGGLRCLIAAQAMPDRFTAPERLEVRSASCPITTPIHP